MSLITRALQVSWYVFLICHFYSISSVAAVERCEIPAGRLVSVQEDVSIQATGASLRIVAGIYHRLCPGDTQRVGQKNRAAVILSSDSVLRIGENSTFPIGHQTPGKAILPNLPLGIINIFSHRPHARNIATPFVDGAVESTLFLFRSYRKTFGEYPRILWVSCIDVDDPGMPARSFSSQHGTIRFLDRQAAVTIPST